LENVLEAAVIALKDRVLGRQKHWPAFHERILEAGVGKSANTLVRIVPKTKIDVKQYFTYIPIKTPPVFL
jgi:hypothetical protein